MSQICDLYVREEAGPEEVITRLLLYHGAAAGVAVAVTAHYIDRAGSSSSVLRCKQQ
jgi:hypothetical protein